MALAGSVIGSFASEAMLFPWQLTTADPPLHPWHGHFVASTAPHTTHSTHTQESGGRQSVTVPQMELSSIGQ